MTQLLRLCPIPLPPDCAPLFGREAWHERRKIGHTASLIAMAQVLREYTLQTPSTPIEAPHASHLSESYHWLRNNSQLIEEKHFYCLTHDQDLLCSRSHTTSLAVAGLCLASFGTLSYGIDLEHEQRPIRPEIYKFFINEADPKFHEFGPLELWALKEASFKALSSWDNFHGQAHSKNLTLKDLTLHYLQPDHAHFSSQLHPKAHGVCQLNRYEIRGETFIIAQARLLSI